MAYRKSFLVAVREMRDEGRTDTKLWDGITIPPEHVEDYIRLRFDHAEGKNLPDGWIPATTYWLVDGGEVVGEVNIRHTLTEYLRTVGGHIGYWIRPSRRRRGYGTTILRLALKKAKKLGLNRTLVSCDETNIGSRKIIEANGGILEKMTEMGPGAPKKLLFWIAL